MPSALIFSDRLGVVEVVDIEPVVDRVLIVSSASHRWFARRNSRRISHFLAVVGFHDVGHGEPHACPRRSDDTYPMRSLSARRRVRATPGAAPCGKPTDLRLYWKAVASWNSGSSVKDAAEGADPRGQPGPLDVAPFGHDRPFALPLAQGDPVLDDLGLSALISRDCAGVLRPAVSLFARLENAGRSVSAPWSCR